MRNEAYPLGGAGHYFTRRLPAPYLYPRYLPQASHAAGLRRLAGVACKSKHFVGTERTVHSKASILYTQNARRVQGRPHASPGTV